VAIDGKAPLDSNFGQLHARHVAALTRHLVACRAAFAGDLDLFLVLTIIGERSFSERNAPPGMTEEQFRASPVSTVAPIAINLQSIADFSGIPRETVRRKVGTLVARGWVRRDPGGLLAVTDAAKDSLQPLTDSSARYLRDLLGALGALAEPG
jgi:hypothetical protein